MEEIHGKDALIRVAIKEFSEKRAKDIMEFESKLTECGISIVDAIDFDAGGHAVAAIDWRKISAEHIVKFSGSEAICFVVRSRAICKVDNSVAVELVNYNLLSKTGNVLARNNMLDLSGLYAAFPGEELFIEEDDDLEDEDQDDGYLVQLSSDQLDALAVLVAKSDGFGSLRNAGLRREFAEGIVSNLEFPEEWGDEWKHRDDDDAEELGFYTMIDYSDIAYRANSIYEYGILPLAVEKMINEEKSAKSICEELGITKAKFDKLKKSKAQDFAVSAIKNFSAIKKFHEAGDSNNG